MTFLNGGHKQSVLCVEFSPLDENLLATGGSDSKVVLWDLSKIGEEQPEEPEEEELPSSLIVRRLLIMFPRNSVILLFWCCLLLLVYP